MGTKFPSYFSCDEEWQCLCCMSFKLYSSPSEIYHKSNFTAFSQFAFELIAHTRTKRCAFFAFCPWFVNIEKEKGLQRRGWGILWSPGREKSISEYKQWRDGQRQSWVTLWDRKAVARFPGLSVRVRNIKVIIIRSERLESKLFLFKWWQNGLFPKSFFLLLWRDPSALPDWTGNEIPQVCPWSVLGCLPSWSCLRTPPNRAWHFHELPKPLERAPHNIGGVAVELGGFPESLSSL